MIKEFQGEYRWLSNFYPVTIFLDGIEYPSVEHAYMSQKSEDNDWKEYCSDPNNKPGDVKRASRKIELVKNWEEIKVEAMYKCLIQKFNKEPFRTKLLNTGDVYIQEGNTWNDKFWGFCLKTNVGKNVLGKLIMDIRSSLI